MRKILVIVPAYNAANTIGELIKRIDGESPDVDVAVIDDGSADNTREIAERCGAITIKHASNKGKGEALKSGFLYAIENGYAAVITMDSDLQHDPAELPQFIANYLDNQTMVIGVRERDKSMPFPRKVSNSTTSLVSSIFSSSRITDSQCGYRLVPTDILKAVTLSSSRYDLEPELLIKALRKGYKLKEIPIKTIYNSGPSSIKPGRDTIRFLIMLFKSLFW